MVVACNFHLFVPRRTARISDVPDPVPGCDVDVVAEGNEAVGGEGHAVELRNRGVAGAELMVVTRSPSRCSSSAPPPEPPSGTCSRLVASSS